MKRDRRLLLTLAVLLAASSVAAGQPRRKIIINEDCSGPGGSNLQTLLTLIQSPQVEVLGITVVSGDQWRNEEVAHTLRLLEIIGRTDIPVMPGAAFPLVRTREETQLWQERYGKVAYAGAWDDRWWHEPFVVPPLAEGRPTIKAADEDAAHFLVRMVHKYPHEVTIYEGGPDDQPCARHFTRSRVRRVGARIGLHGRKPESRDQRSRVRQQSAPRIQFLVRSGGCKHRAARAVEEDRLHADRHLNQDSLDAGNGQAN